jgi:hypothetical protein
LRARVSAQSLAALVGAVFLLVGLLGFVPGITTDHHDLRFAGSGSDAKLLGLFRVSMLHNLLHLVLGAAGIACSAAQTSAVRFLYGVGIASLALWTLGVSGAIDWLPVNSDDNWLHLVVGAGAIWLGYLGATDAAAASPAASPSPL